MSETTDTDRVESQLAEVRAHILMAERAAEALLRHSGLAKQPKKLDKEISRAEAQLAKWREKEAKLLAQVQAGQAEPVEPVAPETSSESDTTPADENEAEAEDATERGSP